MKDHILEWLENMGNNPRSIMHMIIDLTCEDYNEHVQYGRTYELLQEFAKIVDPLEDNPNVNLNVYISLNNEFLEDGRNKMITNRNLVLLGLLDAGLDFLCPKMITHSMVRIDGNTQFHGAGVHITAEFTFNELDNLYILAC